jgi:hypothetical protein
MGRTQIHIGGAGRHGYSLATMQTIQISKHVATAALAATLATGAVIGAAGFQAATVAPAPPDACGNATSAQLRTTLYFGTNRPIGAVSDLEWQLFLRDEVTSRFPDGLTAWEAQGQWRDPKGAIAQERAKVLLIVHADSEKARAAILEVINHYRKMFDQQSVLWETARVCVAS